LIARSGGWVASGPSPAAVGGATAAGAALLALVLAFGVGRLRGRRVGVD
jgi:hypothetical protein